MSDGWIKIGITRFRSGDGALVDAQGAPIALRAQSAEVLRELVLHRGMLVPRTALVTAVWGDVQVTDDSLVQCITDIRRALDDRDHTLIRTIPKKGYILAPADAPEPAPSKQRSRAPLRLAAVVCVGVLTVLASALALSSARIGDDTTPTIAVLPFATETDTPRWTRLGDGLSMEIAYALAHNPELGVIGTDTTRAMSALDPVQAGRQVGATFVLDGDIRSDPKGMAISARLIDVATGRIEWTERWQRDEGDLFAVQEDIVNRANASLFAQFWFGAINQAVARRATAKPTRHLTAFEAYLQGSAAIHWRKPDYAAALTHFTRAVALDKSYARAWVMIGLMKLQMADFVPPEQGARLTIEASDAFRTAFLHQPHEPLAQLFMSSTHLEAGDLPLAQRAVQKAVELAPSNPDILALAAWQSLAVGLEGPDPLTWALRAQALNPKGPPWHRIGTGTAAFVAGDAAQALDVLAEAPPHHRTFVVRIAAHVELGQIEQAQAVAGMLKKVHPDYNLAADLGVLPQTKAVTRLVTNARRGGVRDAPAR